MICRLLSSTSKAGWFALDVINTNSFAKEQNRVRHFVQMIIINYYKGNGCFCRHFFCVDTQFSLDAARIERPQICRLLYFIILMQPFTNPAILGKSLSMSKSSVAPVLILPSTDININNVVIGLSMLSLKMSFAVLFYYMGE